MTPSERRPHTVVRRGERDGVCYPDYLQAWRHWRRVTRWDDPHDVVTCETGRVIDPGTPVIDVNE